MADIEANCDRFLDLVVGLAVCMMIDGVTFKHKLVTLTADTRR